MFSNPHLSSDMANFDDEASASAPSTPVAEHDVGVLANGGSSSAKFKGKNAVTMTRDDEYFMESMFIVFQVENCLFRVPAYLLAKESQVFGGMFRLPQPYPQEHEDAEGSSEANPVILPDEFTKADFRCLLKALYPLSFILHLTLAKEEWLSVLKLSTKWYFLNLRHTAISELERPAMPEDNWLSSLERITYGRKYCISSWFVSGVVDLVMRDTTMTDDEALDIDSEYPTTAYRIFRTRERKFRGSITLRPAASKEIERLFQDELSQIRSDEKAYAVEEVENEFEKPQPPSRCTEQKDEDVEDENKSQPSAFGQTLSPFGQTSSPFGRTPSAFSQTSWEFPSPATPFGKNTKGGGRGKNRNS